MRSGCLRWSGDVGNPTLHNTPGSCFMSPCNCHYSLLVYTSTTWVCQSRFTPKENIFTIAGSLSEQWATARRVALSLGSHLDLNRHRNSILELTMGIYWQAVRRWGLWALSGFGKRLFKQKRKAEELKSQEINVFWSTQLAWEYNILAWQQQNMPFLELSMSRN